MPIVCWLYPSTQQGKVRKTSYAERPWLPDTPGLPLPHTKERGTHSEGTSFILSHFLLQAFDSPDMIYCETSYQRSQTLPEEVSHKKNLLLPRVGQRSVILTLHLRIMTYQEVSSHRDSNMLSRIPEQFLQSSVHPNEVQEWNPQKFPQI